MDGREEVIQINGEFINNNLLRGWYRHYWWERKLSTKLLDEIYNTREDSINQHKEDESQKNRANAGIKIKSMDHPGS